MKSWCLNNTTMKRGKKSQTNYKKEKSLPRQQRAPCVDLTRLTGMQYILKTKSGTSRSKMSCINAGVPNFGPLM